MREIDILTARSAVAPDPGLVSEVQYSLSLSPRQLPARLLYDQLGSALFEAICALPWYQVTRAEQQLLARHGQAIVAAAGRPSRIVELGAGSGEKLATLIESGWASDPRLSIELVDISPAALQAARHRLSVFPEVELTTWALPFEQAFSELAASDESGRRTMVLFLGSNIGNFDPPDAEMFLHQVGAIVRDGDTLLLGTDLVKPADVLCRAYDDPLGVTAAFNRNLLVRLNREFGADFDLFGFAHDARWNAGDGRVEMHLVSLRRQSVQVPAAGLFFEMAAGETIWTERSYKYEAAMVLEQLRRCGFIPEGQWVDGEAGFALTLARAGRR